MNLFIEFQRFTEPLELSYFSHTGHRLFLNLTSMCRNSYFFKLEKKSVVLYPDLNTCDDGTSILYYRNQNKRMILLCFSHSVF